MMQWMLGFLEWLVVFEGIPNSSAVLGLRVEFTDAYNIGRARSWYQFIDMDWIVFHV
jgi:hypothetical protein